MNEKKKMDKKKHFEIRVLSFPSLYMRLSVSDRMEVLMEIKIRSGRGCLAEFAFNRRIKVTFSFKSN